VVLPTDIEQADILSAHLLQVKVRLASHFRFGVEAGFDFLMDHVIRFQFILDGVRFDVAHNF